MSADTRKCCFKPNQHGIFHCLNISGCDKCVKSEAFKLRNTCSQKIKRQRESTFNAVVYILKFTRCATLFANNTIEDTTEENTGKILIIFKNQFSLFKLLRNYFLLLMLIHVETNNFSETLDVFLGFFS